MEKNETKEERYLIIPTEWLHEISEKQNKIISLLENIDGYDATNTIGEYITEDLAKEWIGRKTTWFWNMRTTGQIPFAKVGKKIFYRKEDIKNLLDKNMKEHLIKQA